MRRDGEVTHREIEWKAFEISIIFESGEWLNNIQCFHEILKKYFC